MAINQNLTPTKMALAFVNSRKFLTSNIIGATNLDPPQLVEYCMPVPNQTCGVAQNILKRDLLEYWTSKHDLHTYGALRAGLIDFSPQKFPYHVSDLLKYASLLFLRSMS